MHMPAPAAKNRYSLRPGGHLPLARELILQRIQDALKEKGALRPCDRCGNAELAVLDTIFVEGLDGAAAAAFLSGAEPRAFPTIAVACTNCGALCHHLVGALVPLPDEYQRLCERA
jgi:hypothetical protein